VSSNSSSPTKNRRSRHRFGYDRRTLKEPAPDGKTKFVTVRVDPAIADKLVTEGIKVTGAPPTGFIGTILAWTVPAIIFYFLWSSLPADSPVGKASAAS